jgi:hypothetical protein
MSQLVENFSLAATKTLVYIATELVHQTLIQSARQCQHRRPTKYNLPTKVKDFHVPNTFCQEGVQNSPQNKP